MLSAHTLFFNTHKAPARHLQCLLGRCSKLQHLPGIHRQANASACSPWKLVRLHSEGNTLKGQCDVMHTIAHHTGNKAPAKCPKCLSGRCSKLRQHPEIHRQANATACSPWKLASLHAVLTVKRACCPQVTCVCNTQKVPARHLCWLVRCSKLQQHPGIHKQANATACSPWELVHPHSTRSATTLKASYPWCRPPQRGQGTSKASAVFVRPLQQATAAPGNTQAGQCNCM
jgi:hypothetical protein